MKLFVTTWCLSLLCFTAIAQEITVTSNTGILIKNGTRVSKTTKVTTKVLADFVLAYKEGYITQGFMADELIKKSKTNYTITLESFVKPTINKGSKVIKVAGVLNQCISMNDSKFDFSATEFTNAVGTYMEGFGYNIVKITQTVFKEKNDDIDILIGAEILDLDFDNETSAKSTTAIRVDWTIYDPKEERVLMKIVSAGYCDERTLWQEGVQKALKDAANKMIADPVFINIVNKDDKAIDKKATIPVLTLPLIKATPYSDYENMLDHSIKSVVTIKSDYGHGSGFLISSDGYILTNSHVIRDSERISAILGNGIQIPVTIVAENKQKDIALLKVIGEGYTPLPLFKESVTTGTEVVAIGTPEDVLLGQTVTRGIISGNRVFNEKKYIQTDVSINSGNSGGALINKNGEVVGVIAAKVKGKGIEGLGFAIPIQEAVEALNIKFE